MDLSTKFLDTVIPVLIEAWAIPGIKEGLITIGGLLLWFILKVKAAELWDKIHN